MRQYNEIKAKYPDAMLLFRVGDFYETFGGDAIKAAQILGIVQTKRKNGAAAEIELAGFPHHSLDTYLPKLVRAGQRVAICDQLEDPKMTKTIVKRGVTELVTPGVSFNDQVLQHRSNNFLAAVNMGKDICGVAFVDVSTGEFLVAEGGEEYIDKLLRGFSPSEVLFQRQHQKRFTERFGADWYTYRLDDWAFTREFGYDLLLRHFGTKSLKGFGIEEMSAAIAASGAILHYLEDTQHDRLAHISSVSRIEEDDYVWLDRFTMRNLEILSSSNSGATTLLDVMDETVSPMGARLLKRWLALPLKSLEAIRERHAIVEFLLAHDKLAEELNGLLEHAGDVERLISKAAAGRANPKEVLQIGHSLDIAYQLRDLLADIQQPGLVNIAEGINPCASFREMISRTLDDDAVAVIGKGKVIADGYNAELDELRKLQKSGKDFLKEIQERESKRTGIQSLKVGYNNVFGYYLEVRNTYKDKVPEEWIRKQTLTQAERYITEELKEYESKILGAEEKILHLESQLFSDLLKELVEYITPIQVNAHLMGRLDVLLSFSKVAGRYHYVRPDMDDSTSLDIIEGRHPVIERMLPAEEPYVSNNVRLDNDEQQLMMITGPNMSGKSALLRQTALIVLLAQAGSFVPAKGASIGLVDRIFTRVGASDNISSGESTFMVEMNESASILNNLSNRSLVLLDEIGRGTSTYDGISIAWAIAEYIHEHPKHRAKTLFATHYHELNDMASMYPRIRNYNVSVKEAGNRIIFLRKLKEGGSNHSFGIHVAKMAGMPSTVIERANEVLRRMESTHVAEEKRVAVTSAEDDGDFQLSFFQLDDPILEQIRSEIQGLDIDNLTPVEALMKLHDIKKISGL